MADHYFIEWNGDCWQSVFPAWCAEQSQLHTDVEDAVDYMTHECGVDRELIKVIPREDAQCVKPKS